MSKIKIEINNEPIKYDVKLTDKISDKISYVKDKKCLVITDNNLNDLYKNEINKICKNFKESYTLILRPGENSKNIKSLENIYNKLLNNYFNRDDYIISFGGGVIGDITGLAAATYKRGIKFIQIPTTLLAMVDSSAGGKTAVNYKGYKNMIGTFYNPELVLISTNYLSTLTKREFLNGFAEVIKTAIIGEDKILNLIKAKGYEEIKTNKEILDKIIKLSILFKSDIVKEDLNDNNIRKILNFGHTIGHVLEVNKNMNYKHGEAVALGIKFASFFSVYKNLLNRKEYDKIINVIKRYELPYQLKNDVKFKEIINALKQDKKITNDKITFILLNGLFNPVIKEIELSELQKVWELFINENSSD